jgi:hypothetical protein
MAVYKGSSKIADLGVQGINFGSQQIKQIFTAPITNGITYIPQDIKFEIVNGKTPTLYAGSEVWVPYGKAAPALNIGDSLNSGIITAISWDGSALFYKVRYDTKLNVDSTSDPANAEFVTSISPSHSFWWFDKNVTYSQDTAPSNFGQYALWYDTAENIVKITDTSGATWKNYGSLPIGVFTMAGVGATKKLKYVFNGFGYIGSTAFAVPGVKGLMADGLNEDGSYKTIERTFDKMVMRNIAFNRSAFYGVVLDGEYTIQGDDYMEAAELPYPVPNGYVFCYRTSDNTLWWTRNNCIWVKRHGLPIGFWTTSTGGTSNFNPAKNFIKVYQYNSYEPYKVLCNISNGESSSVEFRKGVYYIRAQGGGGTGGTFGDFVWGRGSGGGSGAGFEGYIYVKRNIIRNVSTGAAVSSGKWEVNGNSTQIENMFIFGGGEGGKTNEALAVGGELTVIANDDYEILTAKYLGNGNGTKVVDGNKRYGGDSVISNDGGALPGGNATAPGAGGGGFDGSGINGGAGGAGECLIQYISYEPEGGVTNLEYFKTPTLTGSITPVAEGNIVVTSSCNSSGWNNLCNNSYIMRNTISTTSDAGYWQMHDSPTQWLQIKFPYTLAIKGMTIASRPNDNYTGTVTAYTNADKTVNMGSVRTNKAATNFTLTDMGIGAFVTDTIYLYITDMDTWYGLQNLQIRGYKVAEGSYVW